MANNEWKEVYSNSKKNTNIAAAATETIIESNRRNLDLYGPFNDWLILNNDAVDIEVYRDGLTSAGNAFVIPKGGSLVVKPEENFYATFFAQKNLDGATAETADKIIFRWARAEKVR